MDDIELSHSQARDLTDRIKVGVEAIWELIKQAYQSRAWAALGYNSWDDYCTREFGTSRIRLPREERQEVVASMREIGMSVRAIASATGTNRETIRQEVSGDRKLSPAPVTGTDGKTYTPRPTPRPEPEPEPESDDPPSWEPAGSLHPADLAELNGQKKSIFLPKPTPDHDQALEEIENKARALSSAPGTGKDVYDTPIEDTNVKLYDNLSHARQALSHLRELESGLMVTGGFTALQPHLDELSEKVQYLHIANQKGNMDTQLEEIVNGTA